MSKINQTLREFGADDGRWVRENFPAFLEIKPIPVEYVIPDPWVVLGDDSIGDMTDIPELDSGPFVMCSKCDQRISPQDSYPVVWIGTKSHAELCETCFRAEEAASRARPCKGLDEEAT